MLSDRLALAFPVFVVMLLAALTFWLDHVVQTTPTASTAGRHDPDYIVDNFVATQMGPDGLVKHRLRARKMTHYLDDDTTHLDDPRITHFTEKRLEVNAVADRALLSSDGEEVTLSGNVRLNRAAVGPQSELTLRTNTLLVTPNKGFARTDQPVIIQDATSRTEAVGLEFDYNTRRLTLMRNVRTVFEARPSPLP